MTEQQEIVFKREQILKKVLFAGIQQYNDTHFPLEIELMQKHVDLGDEVYLLFCDSDIPHNCGTENLVPNCDYCRKKLKALLKMTKLDNKINLIKMPSFKHELKFSKFNDFEELRQLKLDEYDIGNAIASMLISIKRDTHIEITEKLRTHIDIQLNYAYSFAKWLEIILDDYNFDSLFTFNGRPVLQRMCLRVCQKKEVFCEVYEHGFLPNKYVIFENTFAQDLKYRKKQIDVCWESEENFDKKETIAIDWYKKMLHNSFVKKQNTAAKINLNKSKKNIAIFISSEDEFECFDEWRSPLYRNQNDGLQKLLDYEEWDNVHFTVRVHPNLSNLDNEQTKFLNSIQSDRMTVISAESEISSYKLMELADIILAYGSTVGIEACYSKKPVILAGRATYEDLGGFWKPNTHEELCELINDFALTDYDYEGAYISSIKYAWFCCTFGYDLKYFKQTANSEIEYIGEGSSDHFTKIYMRLFRFWSTLKYATKNKILIQAIKNKLRKEFKE